jgi:hypothetical protein
VRPDTRTGEKDVPTSGRFFPFAIAIAAFLALIVIGVWRGDFSEVLLNGSTL